MIKPNNRAFARGKIGQPRSARGNAFPPLVPYGTTFPHFVVGLWMLSHVAMSLQESIETYSAP